MSVRSNNFSSTEVNYLLELVEVNKSVLECKKTDRVSSDDKLKVWSQIEIEYNAKFGGQVYRSAKVLKTKFENVKKESKKRLAAERREMYKTGGGTRDSIPSTTLDGKILSICQPEQIAGSEAIYDDDIIEISQESCIVQIPAESEDFSASPPENFESEPLDMLEKPQYISWQKYTPSNLRKPAHTALKARKRNSATDAWADIATKKAKKAELHMKCIAEEHELVQKKIKMEIDFKKKEHELHVNKLELEIEMLKLQIQLKKKELNINF